ncbi:glycosyltransferase family 9 protein [Aliarcobacter lanthieri]|uniref:glycosyltransferase family 9 protein n=1 Tax=Aliarcobacter lanthieri TaxID=1355374 RepID=UPI00047E40C6|nr:glycosyltransferase family 9 protein [Aliarcobacter lanthieri]QKF59862.1 glycosyltransferase, family 9 [Aliarcobacter lanthieri]
MKKILIIRCGALGDLVYSTSVINALIFEYRDVKIDYVSTPIASKLFEFDDRVDKVFHLKHKKIPIFFSSQKKDIIKYSKKEPYDILINFEMGKQFKSLVEKIVANKKVGWFNEIINIPSRLNRGEQQKYFYNSIISKDNLKISYPEVATIEFDNIKKKFGLADKYIIIAPSNSHVNRSGLNYRAWQNKYWIELIDYLSKKIQVIIVGARGEEQFFKLLQPYPKNVIDLVAKNNIIELSSIIKNALATICTDSAVGHISAATNTPVFVLMGPNDTIIDSPYITPKNKVYPISLKLNCSPCYKTKIMKTCKDNICMKNIKPSYIISILYKAKLL